MTDGVDAQFSDGQFVRVSGLKSPSLHFLNGAVGRIDGNIGQHSKGRYMVICALASSSGGIVDANQFRKAIQPINLQALPPEEFDDRSSLESAGESLMDGDMVEIHSLQAAQELNGKFGQVVCTGHLSETGRVGVAVGFLKPSNIKDAKSQVHVKKIKPQNLRLTPKSACPLVDLTQISAEIAAEIYWCWRVPMPGGIQFEEDLCTKQKTIFRTCRGYCQGEAAVCKCLVSGDGQWPRRLCDTEVIEGRPSFVFDLHLVGLEAVKATGSDGKLDLLQDDEFVKRTGLFTHSKLHGIITGQGLVMLPENQIKKAGPQALVRILDNELAGVGNTTSSSTDCSAKSSTRRSETVGVLVLNPIPPDYDQSDSKFNQNFVPENFDIRKIQKVVGETIPAARDEKQACYSVRYVYATAKDNITRLTGADQVSAERTIMTRGKFDFTAKPELETALGGYDKTHQLLSEALSIDSCQVMNHALCDVFQQFEPQIMLHYRGRVVYNLRLVDGGIVTHDYERMEVPSNFSSNYLPGRYAAFPVADQEKATRKPDFGCNRSNWNTVHTWLNFQIYEDGLEKTFILDMTAPQFGIFGDKVEVYGGEVPDVWSFIKDVREEKRYDASQARSIPASMHSIALLQWIWSKNNWSESCCFKLRQISETFLERRYPPSIRCLPRPYNYPEFQDRSKFFGIGTTSTEDATAFDTVTQLDDALHAHMGQKLAGPGVAITTKEEAQAVIARLPYAQDLERKAGIKVTDFYKHAKQVCTYAELTLGRQRRQPELARRDYVLE